MSKPFLRIGSALTESTGESSELTRAPVFGQVFTEKNPRMLSKRYFYRPTDFYSPETTVWSMIGGKGG